eukprot:scaffold659478_cov51-Prasinocladus_malaysianus.AAC.1
MDTTLSQEETLPEFVPFDLHLFVGIVTDNSVLSAEKASIHLSSAGKMGMRKGPWVIGPLGLRVVATLAEMFGGRCPGGGGANMSGGTKVDLEAREVLLGLSPAGRLGG